MACAQVLDGVRGRHPARLGGGLAPDRVIDHGRGGAQSVAGDQPLACSVDGCSVLAAGHGRDAGRLGAMFSAHPIARSLPVSTPPRPAIAPCVVLLLWVAAAVPIAVSAQDTPEPRIYEARVTRVFDGDTVWVQPLAGGRYRKLRLDGLDAPEICQRGGIESRDTLARRVLRQSLTVTERRRDDYGRGLATLEHTGEDVGGWMVSQGQAWSYRWRRSLGPYQAQETLARAQRRGLFAQGDAEIPRSFRQRHGPCELR